MRRGFGSAGSGKARASPTTPAGQAPFRGMPSPSPRVALVVEPPVAPSIAPAATRSQGRWVAIAAASAVFVPFFVFSAGIAVGSSWSTWH